VKIKPAIYVIRNLIDGNCYVETSLYPTQRHKKHLNLLKLHKHPNYILQSIANKFGLDCFSFEIIEYCKQSELQRKEEDYINKLAPQYNIKRDSDYMYNKEFKESYTSQL
jgi:group I intron endonuclease